MFPTLQNIWFLDSVEFHEATRKVSLFGLFNRISIASGTEYTEGAFIFFSVKNVRGRVWLKLVLTDLEDDQIISDRDVMVEGTPLQTTDVAVRINRIPVPHPGIYAWELYCGTELLGTLRYEATVGGEE